MALAGVPQKASGGMRLSDIGISYDQSSKWQALADVPNECRSGRVPFGLQSWSCRNDVGGLRDEDAFALSER